jgi:NADPH:quinone reductase-like Zn-dependent oxidoreductase
MRAAVQTQYGPPEVVRVRDVPKPSPGEGEVLIKIHATTVNRTDCGFRAAKPWIVRFFSGLVRPKRGTLGCEFAGTIEAVGERVTRFSVGDDVFGFDDEQWGGHAEYMTISENGMLTKKPDALSFQEAAPITEGAHYALFYIRDSGIGQGTRVLVNGATGAIGSASVQLIKELGAHVTAVSRKEHFDLVRSLGADEVIDYESEDFTTCGQTFDVVWDSVGKSTFGRCAPLLKPGGIYMSSDLGPKAQNPFLALCSRLFGGIPRQDGRKVLFPIPKNRREDLEYLKRLVEEGRFKPVVDRTYALEDIVEAYRYVEAGQKVGNVVINLAD